MVYKTNESIIVIQAEATSPNRTNVVFWSHDRGTAKLRMKLVRKNGIPQSLPEGTTVPIRLMFKSATAEGGYGKHDYLATVEDPVNGIVFIVLEDNILGYVGKVEGSVYIDFPNDRSLDTAGRFTFYIKRSPIDDSTPELEDYYFNGFSQTIDKIEKILADGKQEIDQKIAESETQIDAKLKDTNDKITKANQDVATLNTNIDKANDRIDQTNQQIGNLGKLKKMYSNSIDFGDYDYSGNPNLMRVIKASDFRRDGDSDVLISDVEYNSIRLTSQGVNRLSAYTETNIPSLVTGKTYTISAKVKIEEGTTGDIDQLRVAYRKTKDGTVLLTAISEGAVVGKEIIIKGTATVNYKITELERFYLEIKAISTTGIINGSFIVSDVKIEESSTVTPYQPNLLDDPYWLGNVPLGENIANKDIQFPIKSSEYLLYKANLEEEYVIGQTYTVTLKGTKPASQTFVAYNGEAINFGNLKPVEGLTDVWSLTFTPTKIDSTHPKEFRIFQYPQSTVGAVQIDWLKIEKGNKRTPNIPYYKYEGIAPAPSNNPKDYHWGYSPSYINAVEYVPSGDSVGDLIKIENNGTYRTKPRFSFRMKGENGLVALLNQNGAILQFGNPEDVDGTTSSRVEQGLNEEFWGKTLNPALKVNTGFKSVYPNMNSNPATPNLVQGSLNMKDDPDSVQPVFKGVGDINVWHGPTVVGDIAAPSNTDRTLPISTHFRFGFNNYNKGQRGRIEFGTFDELGNPIMTAIIRDSTTVSNEMVFEAWYKNTKIHEKKLDRKVFSKSFYEMNMDRRGNRLVWRVVQIKSLNQAPGGWSQAKIDKEYKFVWTLPEPDTSKFTKAGFWFMRFSNKYHVLMSVTDMQARWEGTPYYQDLRNYFQDGDLVEIDTATREFFVNGVVNNQLNVVGNQWEKFELETGETLIQPIVSEWANMAEVTAEITQNYL